MPKNHIRNYKTKRRKRPSSWKKLQLSKKLKHRLKILGLALLVVISTAVVSGAVALYHFFTKPMATAAGATADGVVFPGGRFNLLLVTLKDAADPTSPIEQLSIITLDADENEVFVVNLPLEVEVSVPLGFGQHQLSAVYALGALTKPQANLDLTSQAVQGLLAVPIDGYIVSDAGGLGQIDQYLGDGLRMVRLLPSLLTDLRRCLKTNLTFTSLLQVGRFVWSARSGEDVWEISPEELFDWQHLDLETQKHFSDAKIIEERLKIQILNGTDKPGLATHISRYVKNLGGDAIIISNFEETNLRQSFMIASDQEVHTVKRLAEVLQIEEVRSGSEEIGERADLTIILGLDSWKNL